jgi:hypothetical protein
MAATVMACRYIRKECHPPGEFTSICADVNDDGTLHAAQPKKICTCDPIIHQ